MDEINLIKSRFSDIAGKSEKQGIWTFSDFLTLAEQDILVKMKLQTENFFFGGYETAERKIAVFGSEYEFGYSAEIPVKCIKIEPASMKFSDELTHRDFLGSLMALGIKREKIGDIIINENTAYLFCLDGISEYIISQLETVKHTSVRCSLTDELPENATPTLSYEELITASDRLDVIISAVYNLSRNDCSLLFNAEKIYVNSSLTVNTSFRPDKGAVISVRGFGRFIYDGVLRTTKKGRNVIAIRKY